MAKAPDDMEKILKDLAGGVSEILKAQKEMGDRLSHLEGRLPQVDEAAQQAAPERPKGGVTYDYRVLYYERIYSLADTQGQKAEMVSTRRCLALRDLAEVRTRYHTGTGERKAVYELRRVPEQEAASDWKEVNYRIHQGAGADFSALLELSGKIYAGDVFEVRHTLEMADTFTSRNEWVTLVVEYPTESFHLEVRLPPGRKIIGARREESMGASHSLNKRRVVPKTAPDTGEIRLIWNQQNPQTGRSFTLFWDW
ncbi:MAG: hypothetical protein O2807_03045 [bacterium]|nr:hypothetical protein [bacterium]